jgi:hypothetical protein
MVMTETLDLSKVSATLFAALGPRRTPSA